MAWLMHRAHVQRNAGDHANSLSEKEKGMQADRPAGNYIGSLMNEDGQSRMGTKTGI